MTGSARIAFRHPPGRHYEVRGRKLWVEEHGEGEPVVLLAGLGPAGSHVVFHPHFDALAHDYRVIYVDLFGRGRSGRPADLREIKFDTDVSDLAALLPALASGPCHLYGFSYGGLLAQGLALDYPECVRSVVLANSLYGPEMWQRNHANLNREIANQYPEVWETIMALRQQGLRSTDPEMQALFNSAAASVRFYDPANVRLLATEEGARNTELYPIFCGDDVDFVIANEIGRIPEFLPRIKELAAPLMVFCGRYDRALFPALQRQILAARPGTPFHILDRSGSFSHVEEPEAVLRLLREFWKTKGASDRCRIRDGSH